MNTGEDESTSGLNGRLRPRKSNTAIPSPIGRSSRKAEVKPNQDKQKRNSTLSKTPPIRTDDLTKPQSLPDLQFLCPYCDRKFVSKLSATKHARRIHLSTSKQDNFIKCLYCNLSEADPHDVIRHMVDNHPNQYFACLDCHTRFPSTTELAEHKLNVCEKQKAPYHSKLRQKHSLNSTKNKKKLNVDQKDKFSNENKEYTSDKTFNGIVISCELKPSQIQDVVDIEDNITTNFILPPGKTLSNTNLQKNAVIVQWNKRITPNFTFHNTDADQILSRLGVVHRSPRVGESTRRAWFKMLDENNPKFEKCFDTNFYTRVASNVQENLTRFLDGSFNFNPDADNTIKTRKSKSSVIINTAEGFPILLACEQFSRHVLDGYMPRQLTPRHKWKWDTTDNADNAVVDRNAIRSDSHVNNCIVTLVSSLDIWTQLCMRRKHDVFNKTSSEKTEINNIITSELKEILESREIPSSSSQIVKYTKPSVVSPEDRPELPSYLGLSPVQPKCELQPAVLSGEWVRPRCYVCCACGAQTRDARGLTSHMSSQHPNAQVQHYEIVGEPLLNADISKHLYVPPNQTANRTRPPRGIRDCTKCKKSIALEDLHQHMLDCAGDTPAVRRKCRYRPFGVRRRRPRLPDNTIRKKIRKEIRSRHRQKGHMRPRPKIRTEVGDAETIRKMIADLPAKRVRVSLNSTSNAKTRKVVESKRDKLKIKRQRADLIKNIATRSQKINAKGVDGDKQSVDTPSDDDDDDAPLKISTKTSSVTKSHDIPKTSTASSNTYNETNNININAAEGNVRQHSDRNKNSNDEQISKGIGEGGNKDNANENNVAHGRETPLKHSIARLTTNDDTQLKSHKITYEDKSIKNNIELKDSPAETFHLFEDETKSDKLDKPPLQEGSKTLDPGGLQRSKLNKPRRRLNDCIAMLVQKTSQAQEYQYTSDVDISHLSNDRDSAQSTTANTEVFERPPTKPCKEKGTIISRAASPIVEGNLSHGPDIATDTINDTESLVASTNSQMQTTPAMYPLSVDPEFMARFSTEAAHYETLRQNSLAHGGLNIGTFDRRRRSHGDPDLAPSRVTQNEGSKRRSTRLKSDSRDYQPRPQYYGIQPGYLNVPPPFGEFYDIPYPHMRRPSYDGLTSLSINPHLYQPQFFPGMANALNIPLISKVTERQNVLSSDNTDKNLRLGIPKMPDVVQNLQTHYASQSNESRRKRWSSTSSEISSHCDYDSNLYIQKSPEGHRIDPYNRGHVNNYYIVSPNASTKLSPRHLSASTRVHREGCKKTLNPLDSDIHNQRPRNTHARTVEENSENVYVSGIDRATGPYYPSRDVDSSSISPLSYENSKKGPEIFYSRVPSKCDDNTSFMEPSTAEIHRKALNNFEPSRAEIHRKALNNFEPSTTEIHKKPHHSFEDQLDISSEYLRTNEQRLQQSQIPEHDDTANNVNTETELIDHRQTASVETARPLFRETTHHNIRDIINIDQPTQQHTENIVISEPSPNFDMVPLDLRSQDKILSDISLRCQQNTLSATSCSSPPKMLSDVSQSSQHNMLSDTLQSSHQNISTDVSQNGQCRLYVRDISELTGFSPVPIQSITDESAKNVNQNRQNDMPGELNQMYSQLSTSGLSGPPSCDLGVARTNNNIIPSGILNNNAIPHPSIPTITLSPPDNGNNTKTGGNSSPQIKQNSIQEVEQITTYDQIDVEKQASTTNPSLGAQTPPANPINAVNITHKKTDIIDRRKLVPKEIIDVIEDLPQIQRDRLLDILPQFVRVSDPQIEASDEVVDNNDQAKKDSSTTTSSMESSNDTVKKSESNLSINTNLMPAPSSVIPKKRHSPNVTYSSQFNVSRTICSTSSLVTPVHPPTVQGFNSLETNSGLMGNNEQLSNTDIHLIDPYTGMIKSRSDSLSLENNEINDDSPISTPDITSTKRVETSMSLEPTKTPARSKNSSDKTSILRMVRFNSSRKSLSDDKQLIYVKDKALQQKDSVSQQQYEEKQNNLQDTIDVQCKRILTANEDLGNDQSHSNIMQTLNDSSAHVIKDSDLDIQKISTVEQNAQNSNICLDSETLAKEGPNENDASKEKLNLVQCLEPDRVNHSTDEKPKTNKLHDVGLQTYDENNVPVNDSVHIESNQLVNGIASTSVDKSPTVENLECFDSNSAIDLQKPETSTEALHETNTSFDSDDEDVSLADIAKSRQPQQTVAKFAKKWSLTKRKKEKSLKKNKTIKKNKKKTGKNIKNILLKNKCTNKNLSTEIITMTFDYDSKDISSIDKIKRQDGLIKSTDQTEFTEANAQDYQELHSNKNIDVTDNVRKSTHVDQTKKDNQNAYTEENVDGVKDAKDETVEDKFVSDKLYQVSECINKKTKNICRLLTDSVPRDFENVQSNNISENMMQKSVTNESEKDNTVVTQKQLLTKKQLIFSKMLCDDDTVTRTHEKDFNISNDRRSSINEASTCDNIIKKSKAVKRKKSPKRKRKNKKHIKVSNSQQDDESDSSQSVHDVITEEKHQNYEKEDLKNGLPKSICTKNNLDGSVDDRNSVDKQTLSEKRKSDMNDVSTKNKKSKVKVIDTETVDDENHQINHQDIVTENTFEQTESVTTDNTEEKLKIRHKDNIYPDSKKRPDASSLETRTTCYNRQIDKTPSRPSSIATDCKNYDPYDIDLDETIAINAPAARKINQAGTSRKNLHTAKAKSPTSTIQSQLSSSDSESSKSDVPLQKYVEAKRMLQKQLKQKKSKNDKNHTKTPDRAVDTNVSETAATANNLEIFLCINLYAEEAKSEFPLSAAEENAKNAENNNEQQTKNKSSSTKNQKAKSEPKKSNETGKNDGNKDCQITKSKKSEVESKKKHNTATKKSKDKEVKESPEKEIKVNKETKHSKEKKRRGSNNAPSVDTVDSTKTSEQTDTDKYLENFGFFSERKPRKSNLLAMKKITETMHMINEGDDAYFSSKDRPTKKPHRESRKSTEEETSMKIPKGNNNRTTKTNMDNLAQPKINDDYIKKIEKVNNNDGILNEDLVSLNTAGIISKKKLHDLDNKVITELKEESVTDPSKPNDDQLIASVGSTIHNETLPNIQGHVDSNFIETKKTNKNKIPKIRPPGYKEKMYPDIEEFDLFEDKFDKIKRKSRTQAAAAKQTNVVDANTSTSRKKTEKKKKNYAKKSYHSSVVPTKGALKGFESIKISISTHDLNMPPNVSPPNVSPPNVSPPNVSPPNVSPPNVSPPNVTLPNVSPPREKKRKRSCSSKKKRERKDSDYSSKYDSDINIREVNVQERDIYEFKDNDDTELLELRPSTVMDRFRSLNKEKSKQKEKSKDKESHKDNKAKQLSVDIDGDKNSNKLKQLDDLYTTNYERKATKKDHDIKVNKCYRQIACDNNKFDDVILSGNIKNETVKSYHNILRDEDAFRNARNYDETDKRDDDDIDYDDDDDVDNVCLVSRSRFVPPTNDDSSFEWNGSPESGFVHMSGGMDCICSPESEFDNETETMCDSSNCIYGKTNPEKNAVMGKIFKNNAVRLDTNDINTVISPKANMDQLFDSLLETNSNDLSSELNISGKNNRDLSPIPSSSNVHTRYNNDISIPTSPREHLKPQTSHNIKTSKRDKKSRSGDAEDAFSRLLNKEDTLLPCVTPPKIDEDSTSNNDDLYRQCILSHNEDACSSDSTDQSNNLGLVDEYVMMSFKNTQTEDPDTIVEDCTTNIKSFSDDDDSDLETESNDIIVLRRYVSTKCHGAQTDDTFDTEYYCDYGERAPRPGDYSMVTSKSTQTRKQNSKMSKHNNDSDTEDLLVNALEKTKITLKKFVATTIKSTQTEPKNKQASKLGNSSSLKLSELSTSKEKMLKKKKVHKTETKLRDDSDDETSAKEDDDVDTNNQYEPVAETTARKSEERISQDYGVDLDSNEDDAGVARQRARRKCTVGKQNVLAEHWSSESEIEASGPRAGSASSTVASSSRRRRGRKRESKRSVNRRSGAREGEGEERCALTSAPQGPTIRARAAAATTTDLSHTWSSDNEEDTGVQPQHGWIVGDSHKKLVTLLANAKRRKRHTRDNDKRNTEE